MQAFFHQSEFEQPHPARARAIIKAHPEVRPLMVRNPYTAFIALSLVIMQEQCRLASLLATRILFP
jgi:sphingolipid 4-desaturase/C4-monooxygenase